MSQQGIQIFTILVLLKGSKIGHGSVAVNQKRSVSVRADGICIGINRKQIAYPLPAEAVGNDTVIGIFANEFIFGVVGSSKHVVNIEDHVFAGHEGIRVNGSAILGQKDHLSATVLEGV